MTTRIAIFALALAMLSFDALAGDVRSDATSTQWSWGRYHARLDQNHAQQTANPENVG